MSEQEKPDTKKAGKMVAGHGPDWWVKEIARSVKAWKTYSERARKVIERYRDERENDKSGTKRFNILFSNTETLKPVIYSQPPVPDIRRRWQDKDPVGRLAATVLQRATSFCLESYDFDSVLDSCSTDYLLPGFAVARAKYKPYFKKTPKVGPDGKPEMVDGKPAFDEEIIYQEALTEYVPWDRFVMSRSRTYERIWYVGYGDDLTRDEVKATFGDKIAGQLSYGKKDHPEADEAEGAELKARVWEVWCKRDRTRAFVAEGFDGWVGEPEPDPLRLQNFFPNPKPLWAISTNDTLRPIPEYTEYQDQAQELDDLTNRIDVLTSALRRRGVYAGAIPALADIANSLGDNEFKAIDDWTSLLEKGGIANLIAEMPIESIANIIMQLEERREKVKQTIYEVTGIADIVRGSSNPNETLGAQQLKGKWAGLRISARQKKFANFARDLVRMKAEIIAERFDPETLSLVSGLKLPHQQEKQQWQQMQAMQQKQAQAMAQQAQAAQQAGQQPPQPPPPPNPEEAKFFAQPTWEEVMEVLRSDKLRGFKIDIETDSTVQPDADAEKAARSELLQALGGFAQSMVPAVQSGLVPQKLAIEAIQFTLRAFKVGSAFEQELDQMSEQPAGPTPEQQQKEQQLQQKEQELGEREAKVKEDEHGAEMAKKDAQRASDKVTADKAIFDLEKRFNEQVEALEERYEQQVKAITGQANSVVQDAFNSIPPSPQPAEPVEKAPRSSGGAIHIHTGGGERKPRKFRMADAPDGSMTLEEMVEQAAKEGEL